MPAFSCRGDDGVNRELEVGLGTCDICYKVVLQALQDILPPPFTERQWPAVRAQLEKYALLPEHLGQLDSHEVLWDR